MRERKRETGFLRLAEEDLLICCEVGDECSPSGGVPVLAVSETSSGGAAVLLELSAIASGKQLIAWMRA